MSDKIREPGKKRHRAGLRFVTADELAALAVPADFAAHCLTYEELAAMADDEFQHQRREQNAQARKRPAR